MPRLRREPVLKEAQTLSYNDLQRIARSWKRGEPTDVTALPPTDAVGPLHFVAMRHPSPETLPVYGNLMTAAMSD